MPLIHTAAFRVRHYECDADGIASPVSYLRYMQEAAFGATAAAGYDLPDYDALNRMWLARETEIEYLAPLAYADTVEVKTWVADFRRVRSIRAYELTNTATAKLVARASTDWVYLDKTTFRPALIPPELILAFYPEGAPEEAPARARFPEPPPPPPDAFSMRRFAEWRDIDPARHVNNAIYLAYAEEAALQANAHAGWAGDRLVEAGLRLSAQRYQVEYRLQAVYNEELDVQTWAFDAEHASFERHTLIRRAADGSLVAQTRARYVCIDAATGRPAHLPDGFASDTAAHA